MHTSFVYMSIITLQVCCDVILHVYIMVNTLYAYQKEKEDHVDSQSYTWGAL